MEHSTPPEAWAFLAFCACCYFWPTWIAFRRGIAPKWSLFYLNAVLGWTGIVYLFCMICAMGLPPAPRVEASPKP